MTDTYEKCSCGSRQKSKCVRESGLGSGKMCVKELKSKDENGYPYWDATTFYPEGAIVTWPDGTTLKARKTTCGEPEDWYDPEKLDKYENDLEELSGK